MDWPKRCREEPRKASLPGVSWPQEGAIGASYILLSGPEGCDRWLTGGVVLVRGTVRHASAVMVTVGVMVGVGVTVAEITTVVVTPWVSVMTTVTLTLSGVGVNVGIGRCVGVGGRVAVGIPLASGHATLVGTRVEVAMAVGELSRATSGTRWDRATRLPMPRQYRSTATAVTTVSRLYSLF
jgi:hypothetical protein